MTAEVHTTSPKVRKTATLRSSHVGLIGRAEELTTRAQKLRRKGELRRAVVALREACALDECDASRWMWLGQALARVGKSDEAERAMKQALYLREQAGEGPKANVIRRLLLNLAHLRHGAA